LQIAAAAIHGVNAWEASGRSPLQSPHAPAPFRVRRESRRRAASGVKPDLHAGIKVGAAQFEVTEQVNAMIERYLQLV
jgi:hypothetical protein